MINIHNIENDSGDIVATVTMESNNTFWLNDLETKESFQVNSSDTAMALWNLLEIVNEIVISIRTNEE
jgi:hypothetical protein